MTNHTIIDIPRETIKIIELSPLQTILIIIGISAISLTLSYILQRVRNQ